MMRRRGGALPPKPGLSTRSPPHWALRRARDVRAMTWVSPFTPRLGLILVHDLVVTAAAVLASFFVRFEEGGLIERGRLLLVILPPFVVFAALVYAFFDVYKAKWRFTSLPELFNLLRASTVLAGALRALDYVLLSPNVYGSFFFGKITIILYWLLQTPVLSVPRITHR